MKFFPNWTDSSPSSLLFSEFVFEEMLEFVKLFPTCFFFADIQPIKHALFLEYVGFKHFVKDLGVFSVDVLC